MTVVMGQQREQELRKGQVELTRVKGAFGGVKWNLGRRCTCVRDNFSALVMKRAGEEEELGRGQLEVTGVKVKLGNMVGREGESFQVN